MTRRLFDKIGPSLPIECLGGLVFCGATLYLATAEDFLPFLLPYIADNYLSIIKYILINCIFYLVVFFITLQKSNSLSQKSLHLYLVLSLFSLFILLFPSLIPLAPPLFVRTSITTLSVLLCLLNLIFFFIFNKGSLWLLPSIVVNGLLVVIAGYDLISFQYNQSHLALLVQGSLLFIFCQILFLFFFIPNNIKALTTKYSQFFPKEFLQIIKKQNIHDAKLGDHAQRTMSILFSDIRNFTTLSEKMTPRESFNFINSYLNVMGPVVRKHNGFIQRVIGDGILALFPGAADDAVTCANAMLKELKLYNEGRDRAKYAPVRIGIGINTGSLMIGIVGEAGRMEGSVFSDAVNLAARLQELTKHYHTPILISEETYRNLSTSNLYRLRKIDRIRVRGREQIITLWEVFDSEPPEIKKYKLAIGPLFDEAVSLYIDRQFEEAEELFLTCLARNPQDATSQMFREQCNFNKRFGDQKNGGEFIRHISYQRVHG